jgi:Ankyrin repeat
MQLLVAYGADVSELTDAGALLEISAFSLFLELDDAVSALLQRCNELGVNLDQALAQGAGKETRAVRPGRHARRGAPGMPCRRRRQGGTYAGCTLLTAAVACGNVPGLQLLLTHGASASAKDCVGNTPLSIAAALGLCDAVKALLGFGADPDACAGEQEEFPLQIALHLWHASAHQAHLRHLPPPDDDSDACMPDMHIVSDNAVAREALALMEEEDEDVDAEVSAQTLVKAEVVQALAAEADEEERLEVERAAGGGSGGGSGSRGGGGADPIVRMRHVVAELWDNSDSQITEEWASDGSGSSVALESSDAGTEDEQGVYEVPMAFGDVLAADNVGLPDDVPNREDSFQAALEGGNPEVRHWPPLGSDSAAALLGEGESDRFLEALAEESLIGSLSSFSNLSNGSMERAFQCGLRRHIFNAVTVPEEVRQMGHSGSTAPMSMSSPVSEERVQRSSVRPSPLANERFPLCLPESTLQLSRPLGAAYRALSSAVPTPAYPLSPATPAGDPSRRSVVSAGHPHMWPGVDARGGGPSRGGAQVGLLGWSGRSSGSWRIPAPGCMPRLRSPLRHRDGGDSPLSSDSPVARGCMRRMHWPQALSMSRPPLRAATPDDKFPAERAEVAGISQPGCCTMALPDLWQYVSQCWVPRERSDGHWTGACLVDCFSTAWMAACWRPAIFRDICAGLLLVLPAWVTASLVQMAAAAIPPHPP